MMKVIPKLQDGNTLQPDNTTVVKPEIPYRIKAKPPQPKQYQFTQDMRSNYEKQQSQAIKDRKNLGTHLNATQHLWNMNPTRAVNQSNAVSEFDNNKNAIKATVAVGSGTMAATAPIATAGSFIGNWLANKVVRATTDSKSWGDLLHTKTGVGSEDVWEMTNPGTLLGGAYGASKQALISNNNLASKFIKGDADLAWNPINKNHWVLNKEARTPANLVMAATNRVAPFLNKVEKLPLKTIAYKAAKRTNGNASVSLQDIKTMPAEYTGSAILGGGNVEGRNLLAHYIFDENPLVKKAFFSKATKGIKPISSNEAKRGFSHGDRYEQLYPGVNDRRYQMQSVVPQGRPLKFNDTADFMNYAGDKPIGKLTGKVGKEVMRMGDKEFMVFREPGTNYVGPIDDVAGHLVKFQMDKGKLKQTSQDIWKFNPADYVKRWSESPNASNQVRLTKQAALMDKVGRPFILQQSNPIRIEGRPVRDLGMLNMKSGGQFTFKKSPLMKKQEDLNGKRDMRKKFVKSSRPTYKKRIKKAQQGMRFASYNVVETPRVELTDITNPINPFSEYNYNTTYDKPEALVVPVRDTNETDVVVDKPTVEPVINKPVASNPVTANSTWKSPYRDRSKWVTDLTSAYKRAGITNDNAIKMLLAQDALESSWGKSAQGKYNFGNLTTGAKWKGDYVTGNDKNAKGEAIKQKFRSYNSMDEYAADKIQFLKRLYDFDENDDISKFVAKLTGSNKGKRRYAEATNYAKVLTGVYNGIPKGQNGMIIKYQNPPHGIAKRDATYVAPKMYAPRPYKTEEEKARERQPNSEIVTVPAKRGINLVDGKLQIIDTPARQVPNVGAGYLSGTDPVGEFIVGNVVAGKPLMWLGKGLGYGATKVSKVIDGEIKTPATIIKKSRTSPYREIGKAIEPKSKSRLEHISVDSPMFGDYIDKGNQQVVFGNATNSGQVLKVVTNRKFTSPSEIKEFHKQWMKRNRLPLQERITFEGYLQGDGRLYPVYSQNRVSTLGNISAREWEKIHLPKLSEEMSKLGYSDNGGVFTNGKLTVGDVSFDNVGYVNGNIRFIDADVYKKGGKLPPS